MGRYVESEECQPRVVAECVGSAARGTTSTVWANLIGVAVVCGALVYLAPLAIMLAIAAFRITSIALTEINARRIVRAVAGEGDVAHALFLFRCSTVLGALSWASLIYPVAPAALPSLPGLVLVVLMTLGAALIMLTFAGFQSVHGWFLGTFFCAVSAYFAWHYEAFGPMPLLIFAVLAMTLMRFASGVARSSYESARNRVEKASLADRLEDALVEARRQSMTDALTGLANRRAFEAAAERIDCTETNRHFVLQIDLDHFKRVNDHLGHAMGDVLLQSVASILVRHRAESGLDTPITARLGGEEFAVVLARCDLRTAQHHAECLREAVVELNRDPAMFVPVSASIGVAEWRAGEDIYGVLQRADEAMYRAKSEGRNRVRLAA